MTPRFNIHGCTHKVLSTRPGESYLQIWEVPTGYWLVDTRQNTKTNLPHSIAKEYCEAWNARKFEKEARR